MPLVSILVPMHNAEQFISKALLSLLQDTETDLEVIVIDDDSQDQSLAKAQAFPDPRIRILRSRARNIAETFNQGLAAAEGPILMRCDADDFYPPQRLQRQVEWLLNHPEFGAVCGRFSTVDDRGRLVSTLATGEQAEEITHELRQGHVRTHFCTFAVRTEILRSLGGCRPYFVTGEDIDLQLRLGEVCRVWYQSENCYYYRLHPTSITHTKSEDERNFYEAIARQLQRQRLTQGQDDLQLGKVLPTPVFSPSQGRSSAIAHIQGQLIRQAWQDHQAGQKWAALKAGWRCLRLNPWRWDYWRSVLALLLKPAGRS
ncbi:glycosyltransferase family 2 protein [Trichothermofontia sp.]